MPLIESKSVIFLEKKMNTEKENNKIALEKVFIESFIQKKFSLLLVSAL